MSENDGGKAKDKYRITIIMAHHNCPKFAGSSNPARPRMQSMGRDHVHNNMYYECPACQTTIMLHAEIKEV